MDEKRVYMEIKGALFAVVIAFSVLSMALASPASGSPMVKGDVNHASIDANGVLMIENAKSNLTAAQKKLSTDLLQLIDDRFLTEWQDTATHKTEMETLGQFLPASSVSPAYDGRVAGDLVYVYVYLRAPTETQTVDPYVWEVTDRDEKNHLAVAWVEVRNLETLASLDAVRTIRTVMPPVFMKGSVTTEGDAIHRTADVRTRYHQSGSGIKVGIISDSVDDWEAARDSGDLPADLTVLNNTIGDDEGTAMLEIVHDMVPDAALYFHDSGANKVAFNAAIDALVEVECNVICDDISWILEPFFEDGIVASHIESVLANKDIIYVSSAGNFAQTHYQGQYLNGGSNYHDKNWYIDIPPGGSAQIVLQWNDAFGASGNDYDLYLCDYYTGTVLASNVDTQDGDDDPLEVLGVTNLGNKIVECTIKVKNRNGAAARKTLELYIYPGSGTKTYIDNIDPKDSIFGQPAVPEVIAVGAINASDPDNDDIECFSSQGPVTISYPSAIKRPKPDLCGIDGVTVTGAGGFPSPFYGTSAAAPHIAAIAAQIWGAFPKETSDAIRNALYKSAVDLGTSGHDSIFGYGRADALLAYYYMLNRTKKPNIKVAPETVEVELPQNTTENYTLTIGNDGNAPLTYNISNEGSWLDVNPKGGSVSPGENDTTTVTISTTGLDLGTYSAEINISHNDPDKKPIIVPVNLTVKSLGYPRWDINEDGITNYLDAAYVGIHYGETTTVPYPRYDINEDGVVNYLDAAYIGIHYGEESP